MNTDERREHVASIPWVTLLKKPRKCDGKRWSDMPSSVKYPKPGQKVDTSEYDCKAVAYWKFKSLKHSWAHDGVYCMSHLVNHCIFRDMPEAYRYERWLAKQKSQANQNPANPSTSS